MDLPSCRSLCVHPGQPPSAGLTPVDFLAGSLYWKVVQNGDKPWPLETVGIKVMLKPVSCSSLNKSWSLPDFQEETSAVTCKPQMVVQPLTAFLCVVAEPALAWHLFSVIAVVSLFDKACLAAVSAALGQPLFFQALVRVSSNNDRASTLLSLIAILFQFISFQRLCQAFKKGRQGSLVSCLWLAGCHAGRNIAGCSRKGLT